jgi:hypothetical protein
MITDKSETIALRATVIAGMRYADDYQVTWRGLTIGRIIKSSGVPAHIAQWSWTCYVHGKPGAGASGTGIDLDDCKQHFKTAWARIRGSLSDDDIARAHRYAEGSAEALARYDRKYGT